ncbi:hypothetical protein HY375_02630 [Candidatus Berkelbacteria bacterium]|nr:hypothetical protein [Candidatus Berkelbacteria bacterium]
MAAQWYSVIVGILLFILGIMLFGTFSIEGAAYAWVYLIVGLIGVIVGFAGGKK